MQLLTGLHADCISSMKYIFLPADYTTGFRLCHIGLNNMEVHEAHPSEDGTEGLDKHRILLSCILPQLIRQTSQQCVVVCGTHVFDLTHAGKGHLAPQLLTLPVQLP